MLVSVFVDLSRELNCVLVGGAVCGNPAQRVLTLSDRYHVIYIELQIAILEATHSKDREIAGFIFLTEASVLQPFCPLCEHVHNCVHY